MVSFLFTGQLLGASGITVQPCGEATLKNIDCTKYTFTFPLYNGRIKCYPKDTVPTTHTTIKLIHKHKPVIRRKCLITKKHSLPLPSELHC